VEAADEGLDSRAALQKIGKVIGEQPMVFTPEKKTAQPTPPAKPDPLEPVQPPEEGLNTLQVFWDSDNDRDVFAYHRPAKKRASFPGLRCKDVFSSRSNSRNMRACT
jgi:hypothetical protein